MNMSAYQKFIRVHKWIAENYSDKLITPDESLKKKYKKLGITNDEIISLTERNKTHRKIRELNLYLETCQVYELEDKHKYLLMLTNTPHLDDDSLWSQVRLPFPEIFLDIEFESDEIASSRSDTKITGILIRENKVIIPHIDSEKKTIDNSVRYGLVAYVCGINSQGFAFIDSLDFPITLNNKSDKVKVVVEDKEFSDFVKKFIINFILFLKDREVTYVQRVRTQSNSARREKLGKQILPDSRIIKLTGHLKRYVDSLQSSDFKGKFSHKFWVSGHWRTYRSDRYKTVKDKVFWISPFIKGAGILVKQIRRIIPDEDENELNYEDIKIGEKQIK